MINRGTRFEGQSIPSGLEEPCPTCNKVYLVRKSRSHYPRQWCSRKCSIPTIQSNYVKKHGKIWNNGLKPIPLTKERKEELRLRANATAKRSRDKQKCDINYRIYRLFHGIKARCKREEIPLSATLKYLAYLWKKQQGCCFYTGKTLTWETGRHHLHARSTQASIDRLDPARGYIKGNLVWCTGSVNRAKSNLTKDEFLALCQVITQRLEPS